MEYLEYSGTERPVAGRYLRGYTTEGAEARKLYLDTYFNGESTAIIVPKPDWVEPDPEQRKIEGGVAPRNTTVNLETKQVEARPLPDGFNKQVLLVRYDRTQKISECEKELAKEPITDGSGFPYHHGGSEGITGLAFYVRSVVDQGARYEPITLRHATDPTRHQIVDTVEKLSAIVDAVLKQRRIAGATRRLVEKDYANFVNQTIATFPDDPTFRDLDVADRAISTYDFPATYKRLRPTSLTPPN